MGSESISRGSMKNVKMGSELIFRVINPIRYLSICTVENRPLFRYALWKIDSDPILDPNFNLTPFFLHFP